MSAYSLIENWLPQTALAENGVPAYSYSPKTAKRSAVGSGSATKEQVAMLVAAELNIEIERIPLDSTDALALAICHAQRALRPELAEMLGKPL